MGRREKGVERSGEYKRASWANIVAPISNLGRSQFGTQQKYYIKRKSSVHLYDHLNLIIYVEMFFKSLLVVNIMTITHEQTISN